jgi:hypothetical protein
VLLAYLGSVIAASLHRCYDGTARKSMIAASLSRRYANTARKLTLVAPWPGESGGVQCRSPLIEVEMRLPKAAPSPPVKNFPRTIAKHRRRAWKNTGACQDRTVRRSRPCPTELPELCGTRAPGERGGEFSAMAVSCAVAPHHTHARQSTPPQKRPPEN